MVETRNLIATLHDRSLLELHAILTALAEELQQRDVPDTRELFAFARRLERQVHAR